MSDPGPAELPSPNPGPVQVPPSSTAPNTDLTEQTALRPRWLTRLLDPRSPYQLVRFAMLRLLGLVYLVAFTVAARQAVPLVGENGLLPTPLYLERVHAASDSLLEAFMRAPTVFWFGFSDAGLTALSWCGVALSCALLLGITNALVQLALWASYLSITQIGQRFYGYGWEMQLLETGFLSIFLCPLRSVRPFASPPPFVTILLFRWLIARIMLGAGLIKIRGDDCWRDLTCLIHHYETQPIPGPLTPWFHALPAWMQKAGVLFNHVVELGAPLLAFAPRTGRLVAGTLFIAFQTTLILSGNLSFLNWLTIVPAIACFDDRALRRVLPARVESRLGALPEVPSKAQLRAAWAYAFIVVVLSINPVTNLLSSRQAMNQSYDPLHLVNTYGAFGSVSRERNEVILEGTRAATLDSHTEWKAYALPCQPGPVDRRPCWLSPYHLRLDWQMWFAALGPAASQPWIFNLITHLLEADPRTLSLFAIDPFHGERPTFVRASYYHYELLPPGSSNWWRRERLGTYIRPLSLEDPVLRRIREHFGWPE